MVPKDAEKLYLDPIEELNETLECTWHTLCDYYFAGGELPEMCCLFMGADLANPRQTAETVVANKVFDLAECICRFSPWYTKPSRAFGISVFRDCKTKSVRCVLAPEAIQKWEPLLELLTNSIRKYRGVIQAMLIVENLVGDSPEDECVSARCACCPPHSVRVNRSALEKMEIYCSVCQSPFV